MRNKHAPNKHTAAFRHVKVDEAARTQCQKKAVNPNKLKKVKSFHKQPTKVL